MTDQTRQGIAKCRAEIALARMGPARDGESAATRQQRAELEAIIGDDPAPERPAERMPYKDDPDEIAPW